MAKNQGKDGKDPLVIIKSDRFDPIRSKVLSMIEKDELPSIAIAVAKHGEIIWQEALGLADKENQIKASPFSMYPLGSLAKSITATGIMVLVDQGIIDINDPIEKYLKITNIRVYEGKSSDLTIKKVINMTGGIPHGWMVYNEPCESPPTNEQINQNVISVFPPGEVFNYSNFAYSIPQFIIEEVSGQTFSDFMQANVFQPLGMKNSLVRFKKEFTNHIVTKYQTDGEKLPHVCFIPLGAANFYASVHDIIRFGNFHLKNRLVEQKQILSNETLDLMHKGKNKGKKETTYSFGWGCINFENGMECLLSNGRIGGASSALLLIPSKGLGITCLTNVSSHWPNPIADNLVFEIADLFIPNFLKNVEQLIEKYEAENAPEPYKPTPQIIGHWEGHIRSIKEEISIKINCDADGKIHISIANEEEQELNELIVQNGRLQGAFDGLLPNTENFQKEHEIMMDVKIDDQRMYGYLNANFSTDQSSILVPNYVQLWKKRKK